MITDAILQPSILYKGSQHVKSVLGYLLHKDYLGLFSYLKSLVTQQNKRNSCE